MPATAVSDRRSGPPTSSASEPPRGVPGASVVPVRGSRDRVAHELLRRVHEDRDGRAREELARRCMPLVRSIVWRFVGRGVETEDLFQVGMVGLVLAVDRFDVTAGHRFVSFAVPTIQGEIRRHFRDRGWAVHVPRAMQELDARVHRARGELERQTGVTAVAEDLARELEITVAQVREAERVGRAFRSDSLDVAVGEGPSLHERRGAVDPDYARVENRILLDEAMRALSAREREIVRWRYEEGLLQHEIAGRLGISQMQVSRLLARSLERMQARVQEADRTHGRMRRRAS